jgi:iron complex outermembrane recepter protein
LLRATPVAAAAAALLSTTAFAQTAPAPETITVTGIRRGIESAISVKKNADGVVEAISAEDIGKLPDTTIAESLARLPGVTTQRDRNGNATSISIRGLGPDFNGYLLNGREQTSTGDSRSVDLSVYPSELIGGATVYKTSDSGLMTSGLAGTIDNRLIDPLAFGNRVIAASVSQTKSGVGLEVKGKGKRYSLSYIDQFADRTLGLAIGYVHSDGNSNSLASGSWGNDNAKATLVDGTKVTGVKIPFGGGLNYETDANTDKRDGFAAILSYKPNKNFQTQLDVYSATIKTATKKNAIKAGTNNGDITNATVVGGVATSGTFALAPDGLVVYSENVFDDDKIDSLGWKSTLKFGDGWSASVDLNSNKAKRTEKDIEVYAGITTADTLSFKTNGDGVPSLTLGNPSAYTNPATLQVRDQSGWSGVTYPDGPYKGRTVPQAGYNKGPTVVDKIDAVRFDMGKDLGDAGLGYFTDVQFGLNYSKRSKDRVTDEGVIISANNGGYDRIPYPGGYVFNNVGGTGLNVLTFDPQDGLWPGAVVLRKFNDDILAKTWSVYEKVTTAYAKLNVDTTLSSIPVTGNLGVQIVNTDQSSAGYRSSATSAVTLNNPAGALTTDGTKYTDVLPSLNLKGDLGGGHVVRFGLGKQLARATLTDLRNTFGIGIDNQTSKLTASSGNPGLKPFKATALDLSYEKYFGNKAYFSVAGFYKKLDTYIVQSTALFDLAPYARQYGVTIPAGTAFGNYTVPTNGSGGNLSGIELAASVPFNLMTDWLEGFGMTASYSTTSSSVKLPNLIGLNPTQQVPSGGDTIQLPGLSKTNTKIMLYYERAGFSVFAAQNQRSAYIGSVANTTVGGYPALVRIDPQTWVSAQIGYEFQDGYLKGLGFRFEGNNLNKPTYREDTGTNINTNKTGASYNFKLSYKYE